MKIVLPEQVKHIIETLMKEGYEAYAVGGCIRDSILGRKPDDWDITTSAKPEEVKQLFKRTIDTGIQHGTVTVLIEREGYEVTTYRVDGEYEDSRHPREVLFTASLTEDLRRRDFTINAMAYNDQDGLVDVFEGIEDIERKVIRAVGNAGERFAEDALRMMRAVRFSAQLGYDIEKETAQAVKRLAPNLRRISAERIQIELTKLLVSPHPEYLYKMYDNGVTKIILPEFDRLMQTEQNNPHHCYSVGEHTLKALTEIEPEKVQRFAMLFHDMGKPQTRSTDEEGIDHFYGHAQISSELSEQVLRRLKFDNDTISKVSKLVGCHDYKMELTERGVRRAVNRIGEDIFTYLPSVKRADILSQSSFQRDRKLEEVRKMEELYEQIKKKQQCVSLRTMAVTGKDLIAIGKRPGKELGELLQSMLEWVLDHPEDNTKEKLLTKFKDVL